MNKNKRLKKYERLEKSILRGIARLPSPYGMPLRQFVSKEMNEDISYGTLYATLYLLEEKELISARYEPGEKERGYRRKLVWSLV